MQTSKHSHEHNRAALRAIPKEEAAKEILDYLKTHPGANFHNIVWDLQLKQLTAFQGLGLLKEQGKAKSTEAWFETSMAPSDFSEEDNGAVIPKQEAEKLILDYVNTNKGARNIELFMALELDHDLVNDVLEDLKARRILSSKPVLLNLEEVIRFGISTKQE